MTEGVKKVIILAMQLSGGRQGNKPGKDLMQEQRARGGNTVTAKPEHCSRLTEIEYRQVHYPDTKSMMLEMEGSSVQWEGSAGKVRWAGHEL